MKTYQTDFLGDHNLGLFGKACDRLCILGSFVLEKSRSQIESTLETRTLRLTVANTDLVGIFCCLNSNGILLPKIISQREMKELKKLKVELGLNLEILKSKFTALGNLVLCNDKGAIISKRLRRDAAKIKDCLGVECEYSTIAKIDTVGSCGIATNKGCLIHRDATEEELKTIKEVLKVKVDIGTANFGSPFVGSCVIANSYGAILGRSTTGPEAARILEALNLI